MDPPVHFDKPGYKFVKAENSSIVGVVTQTVCPLSSPDM